MMMMTMTMNCAVVGYNKNKENKKLYNCIFTAGEKSRFYQLITNYSIRCICWLKSQTLNYKARNGKSKITPQHPSATPSALRRLIKLIQHSYIKSDILILKCIILNTVSQVPVDW
jgi:hypothetical protein